MLSAEYPCRAPFSWTSSPLADERGFFARKLTPMNLRPKIERRWRHAASSFHARKARCGLHYSDAPHEEHKLGRCTAGANFRFIVTFDAVAWFQALVRCGVDGAQPAPLFIPPIRARLRDLSEDAECTT